MSSSTSSTSATTSVIFDSFSIQELLPTEIPAIKTVIADWLKIAKQRYTADCKLAKKAKACGKLTEAERTFVRKLDSSRNILWAMEKYLNSRVAVESAHCSMRIMTARDSTQLQAIAIFESIGNQLMFIASHPNNLVRVTEKAPAGKGAATNIILDLAVKAFEADRSITVHSSPFAKPYFLQLGFYPYLSDQDYADLEASVKKYNGIKPEVELEPQDHITHPILILPQDCYLMLSPEPE